MTKKSSTNKRKFSEEDKLKIRNQVLRDTGFPLKRVENYLQRFNWDLKKLYDYPIVKSAVKKTKLEAQKAKALEDIDLDEDPPSSVTQPTPRKSKKKSTITDVIGNVIDVHDDGTKWFRGKKLVNDSSGLYAPYLTMKEIVSWMKKYGRREVPVYVQKLEEWCKKHKKKYSTWDELSKNEELKESELVEYENYVNWHVYMKRHEPSEFSQKFQKKMKEHFATKELGIC